MKRYSGRRRPIEERDNIGYYILQYNNICDMTIKLIIILVFIIHSNALLKQKST